MKSTTTNVKVSGINESLNNKSSALLLSDFSISEIGMMVFTKSKAEIHEEQILWNTYMKGQPTLLDIIDQLKIFPEAKDYLRQQSTDCIAQNERYEEWLRDCKDIIFRKSKKEDEWFWTSLVEGLAEHKMNRNIYVIKRNHFILVNKKGSSGQMNLLKAKSYPITNLIEFRGGMANCIFHNERTPSLHYYPKTNTVYCFSCHQYGDSIKVYQQLKNCTFKEAVKALQ